MPDPVDGSGSRGSDVTPAGLGVLSPVDPATDTATTAAPERSAEASPLPVSFRRRFHDPRWRQFAFRLLAAAGIAVLSLALLLHPGWLQRFGGYGYAGIFVLSVLSSATLILPAPGWLIPIVAGSALDPFWVGIVAGAGQTLGEMTGYLAGAGGSAIIEDRARYEHLHHLASRYGVVVFALLGFIPNPVFDLAGIAAGALRIPIPVFLASTFVGKTARALLLAYGGSGLVDRFFSL